MHGFICLNMNVAANNNLNNSNITIFTTGAVKRKHFHTSKSFQTLNATNARRHSSQHSCLISIGRDSQGSALVSRSLHFGTRPQSLKTNQCQRTVNNHVTCPLVAKSLKSQCSLFSMLQNLFLQSVEFSKTDLEVFETIFFRFEL